MVIAKYLVICTNPMGCPVWKLSCKTEEEMGG